MVHSETIRAGNISKEIILVISAVQSLHTSESRLLLARLLKESIKEHRQEGETDMVAINEAFLDLVTYQMTEAELTALQS